MKKLPIVCKHSCSYTYVKATKYRPLYVLLLEYNAADNRYYTNFIKEDEQLYGRHYDRWISWDGETIREFQISIDNQPCKVRKTVVERLEVFEEVKQRCTLNKNLHFTSPLLAKFFI